MENLNSSLNDWKPPLFSEGIPILRWPDDVFPEPFGLFARELSRSTETPPELSGLMSLVIVATSIQKNYRIQIKDDYGESLNLWGVVVLPPGSRKSRIYSEVTAPLKEWEKEQKIILESKIQAANSQRKTLDARLKELRNQASKAVDEEKYQQMQRQIADIELNLPEIQGYPQLWTGDVTTEQLAVIMAANDEAMAVLSDEGGIFDILSGLYSDGRANIDLYLQAHSGGSVRIDRKSGPPIFLEEAILTMGLTIQPEVIRNICKNKTFRGKGLLGRFLYVIPKSNIGSRSFDEPPIAPDCVREFRLAIRSILECGSVALEGNIQHSLRLVEEAYEAWLEYAKAIESLMGEDIGHLAHVTDWAGKLPGAIARIAGLLHIMRYAHQKPYEHKISKETMEAAVKIGHILINHALIVFDLLQEGDAQQVAKAVYYWLKQRRCVQVTQRQILRGLRRYKKDDLLPGLDILKEQEVLREIENKHGPGRPSGIFVVEPRIFD